MTDHQKQNMFALSQDTATNGFQGSYANERSLSSQGNGDNDTERDIASSSILTNFNT